VVVENGVRKTYSARYYNPNTGRFMSRDPEDGYAMNPASLHKYLYAGGDPVNMLDPTGRAELFENALIEKSFILETIPAVVSMVGRFVVLEAIPILGRIAVSTAETTAWLARVVAVFVEDALRTKLATGILKLYVCAELGMAFADASIDINSANVPAAEKSEYGRLIDAAMIGVCAAVY
jgi:RHS repeat-associated protein